MVHKLFVLFVSSGHKSISNEQEVFYLVYKMLYNMGYREKVLWDWAAMVDTYYAFHLPPFLWTEATATRPEIRFNVTKRFAINFDIFQLRSDVDMSQLSPPLTLFVCNFYVCIHFWEFLLLQLTEELVTQFSVEFGCRTSLILKSYSAC